MSDLFHKEVAFEFVDRVFETMERANWHTFQVLTKRSSRLRAYVNRRYPTGLRQPISGSVVGRGWIEKVAHSAPARNACIRAFSVNRAVDRLDRAGRS